MHTRSIIYLSYLVIGIILSEALPFFHVLCVTPFMFFCALFIEYFGFRKIIIIYLIEYSFFIVRSFVWFNDFVIELLGMAQSLTHSWFSSSPLFFTCSPYYWTIGVILLAVLQNVLMIWLVHRALRKLGIYKRFRF